MDSLNSYDLLSLHTDELRYEKFSKAPNIFFNQSLQEWIVLKPELVVELLRDERLVVPGIVDAIQKLETRYKRQFPNLLLAARNVPLLLEGDDHRRIRRGLASLLAQGRARTTEALPGLMQRHVAPADKEGRTEWITGCLAPLVRDLFCSMCGLPQSLSFPKLVPTRLFDRYVSLAALDAAEQQVGQLCRDLKMMGSSADEGLMVALFILGRDPLLGALATSLFAILRQNLGRAFADIEFPDYPPETGVAIAERIAERDITVGSETISAGEKVRMFFQPISGADSTVSRYNLFGVGAHSCLGRPISVDVWLALGETLRSFSRKVTSVTCEFETNNIFVVPRHLTTEQS